MITIHGFLSGPLQNKSSIILAHILRSMTHVLIDYSQNNYFFTVVEGSTPGPKTCACVYIPQGEVKTEVTIIDVTITSKLFVSPHASFIGKLFSINSQLPFSKT
jgi:hypothetical protein